MARKPKTETAPLEIKDRVTLPVLPELTSADFAGKPRWSWLLYLVGRDALAIADKLTEENATLSTLLIEESIELGRRLMDGDPDLDVGVAEARLLQIHTQLRAAYNP